VIYSENTITILSEYIEYDLIRYMCGMAILKLFTKNLFNES